MATQKISDLTNDEQAAVRLGECAAIRSKLLTTIAWNVYLDPTFGTLYDNLTSRGQKFAIFGKSEYKKIIKAARADAEVAIVLGDLDATKEALVDCGKDAKLIARDDYKPNFIKG